MDTELAPGAYRAVEFDEETGDWNQRPLTSSINGIETDPVDVETGESAVPAL